MKPEHTEQEIINRDLTCWSRLSRYYERMLLNRKTAHKESRAYEDFEDQHLDKVIEGEIKRGHKIALVEIGVGTGRYAKRYGKHERYARDILLFVGVDFSMKMLVQSYRALDQSSLLNELGRKILLIRARGENFLLSIERHEGLKNATPIVFCMFNTLGNIEPENRRREILMSMKKIIGSGGLGIISVFNRDELYPLGAVYYGSKVMSPIKPTPEAPLTFVGSDVRTPDFVSHWFTVEELNGLFKELGLKVIPRYTVIGTEYPKDHAARRGIIYTFRSGVEP